MIGGDDIKALGALLLLGGILGAAWGVGATRDYPGTPAALPEETVAPLEVADPCGLEAVVCEGEIERDSREDLWARIQAAAAAAGIDPELAVRVAVCESGLDPQARNPNSSAKGLYQFIDGTWEHIGSPGDPLNSDDAIAAFVEWFPRYPGWWDESRHCWQE